MVLEIKNLTGGYNRKKVIENVTFNIPKGNITALIGLNGAGKSTTIKHILGLLKPMSGEIKVDNITIFDNVEQYRKNISYIPESPILYEELTLEEHINLVGMSYGMTLEETWNKADKLLELFNLSDKKKFFPVYFSKGMKQKVMIICSFLVEPNLYIIDEPFLGLDPIAINDLINLMCSEKEKGKSILMSTHILATAERYCDNFIIIHEGKILANGTLDDIREQFNMSGATLDEIYLKLTKGN
ncbi:ABC transporter ATP-binding protein [Gemella sp. GH3]|uniref:ABC transporter ATP-binding protein n=1 Tax=unclassified Gemella TaxID=2624949 RepID=UPI0015D02C93|nr:MULTISPECIES: ABC transporter ATP-binding protein [unclassified Gemella]MBF0713466.1 ABC transporter ATP-binding protein [Gemella sp. GH3.1]NYS50418.1 ABC transporter ATP-binding protein [Gemella sp. GH3]